MKRDWFGGPLRLRFQDLSDLLESDRRDVLSVYLDVDATKPENQAAPPAYLIWLRNALREAIDRLHEDRRHAAEEPGVAVVRFVESMKPGGRGLAIFAAPDLWREYVLPFPLPNRVAHGLPDLMPLLWAMDEYEPYSVLVIDREHARILVTSLGTATVVEEETLELDTSDWKFKSGRPPTFTKAAGVGASRGAQRDTFVARVEEHVHRFWRSAADAVARLLDDSQINRLIIGGPEEAVSAVRDMLPERTRAKLVGVVPLPAHADLPEIRERTLPVALAEEHRHDAALVADVLARAAAGGAGALGKVATVRALAAGQVRTLVADRDLEGEIWKCGVCHYTSDRPLDRCPTCGGEVERFSLPQLLPILSYRTDAAIELVRKEAAEGLKPYDGVGAILRYVAESA